MKIYGQMPSYGTDWKKKLLPPGSGTLVLNLLAGLSIGSPSSPSIWCSSPSGRSGRHKHDVECSSDRKTGQNPVQPITRLSVNVTMDLYSAFYSRGTVYLITEKQALFSSTYGIEVKKEEAHIVRPYSRHFAAKSSLKALHTTIFEKARYFIEQLNICSL